VDSRRGIKKPALPLELMANGEKGKGQKQANTTNQRKSTERQTNQGKGGVETEQQYSSRRRPAQGWRVWHSRGHGGPKAKPEIATGGAQEKGL